MLLNHERKHKIKDNRFLITILNTSAKRVLCLGRRAKAATLYIDIYGPYISPLPRLALPELPYCLISPTLYSNYKNDITAKIHKYKTNKQTLLVV